MLNKRGLSHVEMILSFTLFIGVVGVAFFFFNPVSDKDLKDTTLNYAVMGIKNNASVNVVRYSVFIDNSDESNTEYIEPDKAVVITIDNLPEGNVKIKDYESDNLFSGVRENNEVKFSHPSGWQAKKYLFYIYISSEFDAGNVFGDNNNVNQIMTLGERVDFKMLSEKRLELIANKYGDGIDAGYFSLKKDLNIPISTDFSFVIEYGGDKIEGVKEPPPGIEVYAHMERVEVIKSTGESLYGDLLVKTW